MMSTEKEKSYKESWVYREVTKNYKVEVSGNSVKVLWDDGDVYAEFRVEKDDEPDKSFNLGYFIYLVEGDCDTLINDEVDFYGTYDEAVTSCLYYFHTRF
jgi:hypothetical protein